MENLDSLVTSSVKLVESTQQLTQGQEKEQGSKTYRVDGGIYTKDELLWKRLSDLYGYTFTRQYGSEPSEGWKMVLDKISPKQIGKGLNACLDKHKKFPPNPIEFFSLCLPSSADYGLPGNDEAFSQAVGISTSKHAAVSFTLRNMGDSVFEMRRSSSDAAKDLFISEWLKTIAYISEGGEIPAKSVEIEKKKKRVDKADALAMLAAIKAESCPDGPKSANNEEKLRSGVIGRAAAEDQLKAMRAAVRGDA